MKDVTTTPPTQTHAKKKQPWSLLHAFAMKNHIIQFMTANMLELPFLDKAFLRVVRHASRTGLVLADPDLSAREHGARFSVVEEVRFLVYEHEDSLAFPCVDSADVHYSQYQGEQAQRQRDVEERVFHNHILSFMIII